MTNVFLKEQQQERKKSTFLAKSHEEGDVYNEKRTHHSNRGITDKHIQLIRELPQHSNNTRKNRMCNCTH